MIRHSIAERENLPQIAKDFGFNFHTIDGDRYWDERYYYEFTLKQVEDDLEDPTKSIHDICMELVDEVTKSEELLEKLCIPKYYWDQVKHSWDNGQPHLYGRMDFSYDGKSHAKLLELNYDTPTSLYEAGFFQWQWLESMIRDGKLPEHFSQFNSIQDKLLEAFVHLKNIKALPEPLYLSATNESIEDQGTVQYLRDIAMYAGLKTEMIGLEDIGWNHDKQEFVDHQERNIPSLFKLHAWEHMFREEFGRFVPHSNTLFIEPTWKAILSNKGILPLLWNRHPKHPNLLETHFDPDPSASLRKGCVRKPFFSREGANVEINTDLGETVKVDGPYTDAPYILQEFSPLPKFGDNYTLIGSWVVGNQPAGIGIREDNSLITKDSSLFIPHVFS